MSSFCNQKWTPSMTPTAQEIIATTESIHRTRENGEKISSLQKQAMNTREHTKPESQKTYRTHLQELHLRHGVPVDQFLTSRAAALG